MTSQSGETLGRYRLEEAVGQGGMAVVYRAVDTVLGRTVAVKLIRPAFTGDAQFLERFLQEARLVASLDHPNILPVYDFGEHDGKPYLVLPFLQGGTLGGRLEGRPQTLPRAAAWLVQLGGALDAAHARGVLHRDVKPGNVLIGGDGRLVLGDFGIARLAEVSTRMTATGMVVGTPLYMAPELARGSDASPASDRYALAVIAYEMVAGRPPFTGSNPLSILHQQVNEPVPRLAGELPELPRGVDAWLQRGLAKDPAQRPPSARAFAEELVAMLSPEQRAELSTLVWTGGADLGALSAAEAPTVVTPGTTLPQAARDATAPTRRMPGSGSGATAAATPLATPLAARRGVPALVWGLAALALVAAVLIVAPWDRRRTPDAATAPPEGVTAVPVGESDAATATAPVASGAPPADTPHAPAGAVALTTAVPATAGESAGATAAALPAAAPPAVAPAPLVATAAQAREALGLLRRPSRRLAAADFAQVSARAAQLRADPRLATAMSLGEEWAKGGAAYAEGRDADAERHRAALVASLPAAAASAPWGIAWPALVFQDAPPQLARATLYADARGELAGLAGGASGGDPAALVLATAWLRHLEGDHAGASGAVTGAGLDVARLPNPRMRALVAQLMMAEELESGDGPGAAAWRGTAIAGGNAPLARGFLLEMAGVAGSTLRPLEAMAFRDEACKAGVVQLCRGATGGQSGAEPGTADRSGPRQGAGPRRRQPPRRGGGAGGGNGGGAG
jgi:hypothetical protein